MKRKSLGHLRPIQINFSVFVCVNIPETFYDCKWTINKFVPQGSILHTRPNSHMFPTYASQVKCPLNIFFFFSRSRSWADSTRITVVRHSNSLHAYVGRTFVLLLPNHHKSLSWRRKDECWGLNLGGNLRKKGQLRATYLSLDWSLWQSQEARLGRPWIMFMIFWCSHLEEN